MMTMTMQLDCQGWVKVLLLPWPGTAVAAQEKWLQFLGALQLLDEAHMSVSAQKKEYRNTKEDQNTSFGVSVTPDENWVIAEKLFQPLYPITKRNQHLKIKLRVPELY